VFECSVSSVITDFRKYESSVTKRKKKQEIVKKSEEERQKGAQLVFVVSEGRIIQPPVAIGGKVERERSRSVPYILG
jgi:Mg-chelatase subunit ChlD